MPKYIIEFLNVYEGFSIGPSNKAYTTLKGTYYLKSTFNGKNELEDSYELIIKVPLDFPRSIPVVEEVGGKIPKKSEFHVNPDGSLCLGSPLRLLLTLKKYPSLVDYLEILINHYLYAITFKLKNGGDLIGGELPHGVLGEISDYEDIFGLKGASSITRSLFALAQKKRVANKMICPCNCGRKLGLCIFHYKINSLRKAIPRQKSKAMYYAVIKAISPKNTNIQ